MEKNLMKVIESLFCVPECFIGLYSFSADAVLGTKRVKRTLLE